MNVKVNWNKPLKLSVLEEIMVALAILDAVATTVFAQGLVYFVNGTSSSTKISTNSVFGGSATGLTGANASGTYCYALFASTSQSSVNGNTVAVSGVSSDYVFNNLGGGTPATGWELVGIGTNTALAGRMTAASQGTTSAGQGPLNADGSLTVQGIAGGENANFVVVGWSANIGTTLATVETWYVFGGPGGGWIGQSAVSSGLTLGDGGLIPTSNVFGTGFGQVPGFTLGVIPPVGPIPPSLTSEPASQSILAGTNVTFSAGVNGGTGPSTNQWQFNGSNLTDNNRISGSRNNSLTISNVLPTDAGNYRLFVCSAYGSATSSNAILTVTVGLPPSSPVFLNAALVKSNGNCNFTWSAPGYAYYHVQYKTNLNQPNWINLGGTNFAAGDTTMSFSDTNAAYGSTRRFYRIMSP